MADENSFDWDVVAALATFAAPVVIAAVLKALGERRAQPLNRYQVAVAAGQPVAEVTPVLEEMVQRGVVNATGGDANTPNTREYQLRPEVAA
jgi:DNA-binding IclR family transcriptional regulator